MNFQFQLPNYAPEHSLLAYATNDWSLTGLGVLQSGEPYSLYEFYGAVGSLNFGNYPTLMNPVLPPFFFAVCFPEWIWGTIS